MHRRIRTKEQYKKREFKRKSGGAKKVSLWIKCYGLCFYCGVQTHCLSILKKVYGRDNVLSHEQLNYEERRDGIIKYRKSEFSEWISVPMATVDHTLELDHPKCNYQENLRLACCKCNQKLSKEKSLRLQNERNSS